MATETKSWPRIKGLLDALKLDPRRIENVAGKGTPDVNYTFGWIERKWLADWPKRASTPVMLESLVDNPPQASWAVQRWTRGGPCYMSLQVGPQVLFFAAPDMPDVRRGLTRVEMLSRAVWTCGRGANRVTPEKLDWLRAWLTWKPHEMPLNQAARFYRLLCSASLDQMATSMKVDRSAVLAAELNLTPLSCDLVEFWIA